LLAVPLQSSHHVVDIRDDGLITQVTPMRELRQWENGGYFLLRQEIFDHLGEGEDLVEDALRRLVAQRQVLAYPYKGYWSPADTVKERAQLEDMYHSGNCPWMVWDPERSSTEDQLVVDPQAVDLYQPAVLGQRAVLGQPVDLSEPGSRGRTEPPAAKLVT
jgi:NDP-sugar pyrophosphorylase family protein